MKKKFAIPTLNEKLTAHFGHCEKFAIVDVEDDKVVNEEFIVPPVHQPGVYPKFLADQGVHVIIAGGMGQRAQDLFHQNQIETIVGASSEDPEILVKKYLEGNLSNGDNTCDH